MFIISSFPWHGVGGGCKSEGRILSDWEMSAIWVHGVKFPENKKKLCFKNLKKKISGDDHCCFLAWEETVTTSSTPSVGMQRAEEDWGTGQAAWLLRGWLC